MQEKDYIEKLINENLDELNDNEPMNGHFDRFAEKMNVRNKPGITLRSVLKIVAAVLFVLLAGNQVFIYFTSDSKGIIGWMKGSSGKNEMSLATISTEYKDAEFYYTSSINAELGQWTELCNEGLIPAEEQEMMKKELADFENMYKGLQKDLFENPDDERVVNAMLEYYQAKLNIISMIVSKLKDVKKEKDKHYENM